MKALSSDDFEDATVITTQDAEDITLAQRDIDDQINSIFSEVGSDNREVTFHFQVWRVLKDQADTAFLFKGLISDLPIMERLRDEYDGGKFFIQVYRNKKRYRQLRVTVEAPKKPAVPAALKNDMAEMIKAVSEQQERQFTMLRETMMQMVGKPSTPAPSQIETMTVMMGLMKSMKDFAAPPPQSNTVSPDKMIDILMKGMELGRESGGGGSETNFLDVVKEALKSPLLLSAANQVTNMIPAPRPIAPNPASLTNKSVSIPNQSEQIKEVPKMNNVIVHNINMLVSKAEKGADPILYAEFIMDNVPEEIINQYIVQDDLIAQLSKINPKVSDYKEWFLELRDHIQGVLTGVGEDDDNMSNESTINPNDLNTGGDGGDKTDP